MWLNCVLGIFIEHMCCYGYSFHWFRVIDSMLKMCKISYNILTPNVCKTRSTNVCIRVWVSSHLLWNSLRYIGLNLNKMMAFKSFFLFSSRCTAYAKVSQLCCCDVCVCVFFFRVPYLFGRTCTLFTPFWI